MLQGLLDNVIAVFNGDPGVRKVADDPVLSAELLLLFRMILADGAVSESEMAVFRRICRESFSIPEGSIDGVIDYLNEFGYETNASQAIAMFRDIAQRYPQSWNAQDSLGEALVVKGDKAGAIAAYEKALAMVTDPDQKKRITQALAQLKK